MTLSNPLKYRPRSLTRAEAIACGVVIDLMEQPVSRDMVVEMGFGMPVAMTFAVYSQRLNTRKMLRTLQSALPFVPCQKAVSFQVPQRTRGMPSIRLKALKEFEDLSPVITVMMPDEGISN